VTYNSSSYVGVPAGGATLSLLAPLHFDYKLSLFNGPDLMALPGVKQAVNWALGVSRHWSNCHLTGR
jgi:hypothetical protein